MGSDVYDLLLKKFDIYSKNAIHYKEFMKFMIQTCTYN